MSEGLVSPLYRGPVSQLESEEHERMQDFWCHVQETAGTEPLSYRRGPLSIEVEGVIDEVTTDIHIATMGSYGYELSLPEGYREETTRDFDVEDVMRPHNSLEEKWEGQRLRGLLGLAQQIMWQRHGFRIPKGVTARPESVSPLTHLRSCAAATVATVAQDLTGLPLLASDILHPIHAIRDDRVVRANGELLSILTSSLFTERYGWDCQAAGLSGMDLDSLQKVLTHVRARRSDDRVYCSLAIMTGRGELRCPSSVLHTVLLDHADSESVTTIEPRTGRRRPASELLVTTSSTDFLRRWAVGGFQGYIVLAEQVST